MNLDYRTMFNSTIGPILNHFGFHLNNDGVIQKIGGSIGITLSGKHLYVPSDGYDYFSIKDSNILVPFNPFKIREHLLILSKFVCTAFSSMFRDEDDTFEYNSAGDLIDIVTLVKRGIKTSDGLPATFHGVIYEIWCRDENDVIGFGIDDDGNDIKAILMCMIDALSKYTHLVDKNPNFAQIFRYIERCEVKKDLEVEDARSKFATNNTNLDLNQSVGDVDLEVDPEKQIEEVEQEPTRQYQEESSPWDDLEF